MRASFGLVTCSLITAIIAGCSSGQISQTATQEPAINGVNIQVGTIALRNLHLLTSKQYNKTNFQTEAQLIFVAVNGSTELSSKLISVRTTVGYLMLSGSQTIPANGILTVNSTDTFLRLSEKAEHCTAKVILLRPIINGLSYKFKFKLNRGEAIVEIPVSSN